MRPEKDLMYPGAVETDRDFTPARSGRTVDGNNFDNSATLSVRFTVAGVDDPANVVVWFGEALKAKGWTADMTATGTQISAKKQANGNLHVFQLNFYKQPSRYVIKYLISEIK